VSQIRLSLVVRVISFVFRLFQTLSFLDKDALNTGPIEKCPTSEYVEGLDRLRRRALLDGACDNLQAVRL